MAANRRAGVSDLAAFAGLADACGLPPRSADTYARWLGGGRYVAWLREAGGPVGLLACEEAAADWNVLDLAVLPQARGQGHGRALLREALAALARLGGARCLLEVRASNQVARALYGTLGFEEDGTRPGYYPTATGREPAILMSLSLDGVA